MSWPPEGVPAWILGSTALNAFLAAIFFLLWMLALWRADDSQSLVFHRWLRIACATLFL